MTPAMTAHRAQLAQELRDEEAARRWSVGGVRRDRLADVCRDVPGAAQVITGWVVYPEWDQLIELAQLCGVEPLWFMTD